MVNLSKEYPMSRFISCCLSALLLASPSVVTAQTLQSARGDQGEAKDLTDVRIDVVKRALQLSPEQAKYWPAIEEAMRARAEGRRERLKNVAIRAADGQSDRDFVKLIQNRATNLSERGAELKKLADAWQPLDATLSDTQKARMRILAMIVLRGMRQDMMDRRDQISEDEEGPSAAVGPGSGESGADR